ncbi:MAG: hypothetical protein IJ313_00595 [Clostridia bacterium]|nr:hypothetical protein [Clostridia bacterium]
MWIITSDRVHEAGINPAANVPKSRDYMSQATRKKAACRKHVFRLTKSGRELFRGVAYFEKDATFKENLRPLDEFGRAMYDCDGIEYLVKYRNLMPGGCNVWNKVPEEAGREFDTAGKNGHICQRCGNIYGAFLRVFAHDSICEATEREINDYLESLYQVYGKR